MWSYILAAIHAVINQRINDSYPCISSSRVVLLMFRQKLWSCSEWICMKILLKLSRELLNQGSSPSVMQLSLLVWKMGGGGVDSFYWLLFVDWQEGSHGNVYIIHIYLNWKFFFNRHFKIFLSYLIWMSPHSYRYLI